MECILYVFNKFISIPVSTSLCMTTEPLPLEKQLEILVKKNEEILSTIQKIQTKLQALMEEVEAISEEEEILPKKVQRKVPKKNFVGTKRNRYEPKKRWRGKRYFN